VALSHSTASMVWLFPADAGTELDVQLSYTLPVAPATGTACPAATAAGTFRLALPAARAGTGTAAGTQRRWPLYAGGGMLAVGLLGLAAVAIVLRRRGRTRGGRAAFAVLLLAAVAATTAPRPAHADLSNSVAIDRAFGTCLGIFAKNDPAGIMPTILGNTSHIRVVPYTDHPLSTPAATSSSPGTRTARRWRGRRST
jgi:hypothetical protein